MPYDNANRGALFKNDRKEGERDPDYRGELDVDGRAFWINAWLKTSKAGNRFMSLSVKLKPAEQPKARTSAMGRADLGDDPAF